MKTKRKIYFISSSWLNLLEYIVGYMYIINLYVSTVRTPYSLVG